MNWGAMAREVFRRGHARTTHAHANVGMAPGWFAKAPDKLRRRQLQNAVQYQAVRIDDEPTDGHGRLPLTRTAPRALCALHAPPDDERGQHDHHDHVESE